jgi:uncharacterized protein (DUF2141 family)
VKTTLCCAFIVLLTLSTFAQKPAAAAPQTFTLTVVVEHVNEEGGNIGVLVFNSPKGWPEDRKLALKDVVVKAHPGTVTVTVPDLPAGNYAVAVAHDVNVNHKLDKNWLGMPKEQYAVSNNPHVVLKAPSFDTARFSISGNTEIHVTAHM